MVVIIFLNFWKITYSINNDKIPKILQVQKLQDRLTRTEDQLARSAGSDVSTAQQECYDRLLEKCKSQIQVAEDAKLQVD